MPRSARKDGLFEPNLLLQFFLTTQAVGRLVDCAVEPVGTSAAEYALLSVVDELEPVTPSDISRLTGIPRPTLTSLISRLVAQSFVQRRINPRDGRSYTLMLTAEGRRAREEGGRLLGETLKLLGAHLEDDPATLTAALARLRDACECALEPQIGSNSESQAEDRILSPGAVLAPKFV